MTIMDERYLRPGTRAARRMRNACVALALVVAGCSSEQTGRPAAPPSSAPALASAPAPPPRSYGPAWAAAEKSDDEADLARLALAEGASGLLEAIDDPPHRAVALHALPHAPDRDLAIGALAARVAKGSPEAGAFADALLGVLAPAGADRERLDPTGETGAARDLLAVATDETRPKELRRKAASALWRLAERGVLPREKVPVVND